MPSGKSLRLPEWIRTGLPREGAFGATDRTIGAMGLNTVCRSARCPNMTECFSRGTGTFLIMGTRCTRSCAFCNIAGGVPEPLLADEPARVAEAAKALKLAYVVITSVTRDDLPDGGAAHFAATIRAVRAALPESGVEVLIPDFKGREQDLLTVIEAGPDVVNHNLETVPRLYRTVRPQADFERSFTLLARAKGNGAVRTKSGLMVGLGEQESEIEEVLARLAEVSCDMVTIGQYLRPSKAHPEVARYVHPSEFDRYAQAGEALGIGRMFCGPLVRSSYHAGEFSGRERAKPI
jgi:lipoyl synthase